MYSGTVAVQHVTYGASDDESVQDALARVGVPVIPMAEVATYKAAELAAAPEPTKYGTWMKFWARFSLRYNGVEVRGRAKWHRRVVVHDKCGAPEALVRRADAALRTVPGRIEIDELVQDTVVLDPVMYHVSGPRWWPTRTPIGIWKDVTLIR